MFHIMKKEAKAFLFYIFIILPLTLYWVISRDRLDVIMVFIQGLILTMLVVIPVLINEQHEEKHNGYQLMSILPIKKIEIIAAKFITVLTAAVVLVAGNCLFFSFFAGSSDGMTTSRSFILLAGISGILLAALVYIGIFIFGYTKFLMIASSTMVGLGLVPPLLVKYLRPDMDALVVRVSDFIKNLNWGIAIVLSLILYFLLMFAACKLKRKDT
jgi:hypothetical protein